MSVPQTIVSTEGSSETGLLDVIIPPPPASRTGKFLWAAAMGWGNQALNLVVGLWLTRFLLAHLGADTLGWWAQAIAVLSYLGIVDFGISVLLPREVAAATGRAGGWRTATDLPAVIAPFVKFALLQMPVAALVGAACYVVLARTHNASVAASLVLMVVATLLFPLRLGPLIVTGLQDFKFSGAVAMTVYLTGVGTTIAVTLVGGGAFALVAGWALQSVLTAALIWWRLGTRYGTILPSAPIAVAAHVPRRMLTDGVWAWLSGVGIF